VAGRGGSCVWVVGSVGWGVVYGWGVLVAAWWGVGSVLEK